VKLTIDIGNTNILFAFFINKKIISSERLRTEEASLRKIEKIMSKYPNLEEIIISSVVPLIDKLLISYLNSKGLKFLLLKDLIENFKFKTNIRNRNEIGDDRIVNMIYAKKLFRNSVVVIDFGTATTLDVLDHRGVYSGGVITPGIDLSLNTLKKMTAKLPLVKFKRTKNVVGRNTVQAIQSGFFWGYVSMIEGLINKLNQEKNDRFKIILTGGNATFFKKMFKNISLIDDLFTSRALNYIISEVKK
jgi:type III pantothenate kinase